MSDCSLFRSGLPVTAPLPVLLLLVLLAGGCSREADRGAARSSPSPPAQDRGSLIFITLDTFRADAAGCGGSPRARTPHLDRLAREGLQFERGLTVSPLTLPSHASMLTGVNPPAHGARSNGTFRLSADVATLAEELGNRGFVTGAFLAAFALDGKFGLDRGFDVYDDAIASQGSLPFEMAQRTGDKVVDTALAWGRTLPAGVRRFEWVHLFDAHQPYEAPRARREAAGGDLYLGAVSEADAHLGRRLRARARDGDEAWIVVLGDHGESRGDHAEDTHGLFLYGATMKVPAVVWPAPRGRQPGLVRATFRGVDVPATAFELLGLDPAEAPGRGESALNEHSAPGFMETLYPYLHFGWAELRALDDGEWKYVEAPSPELYDLNADPGEARDVHGDHPERARRMSELLASMLSAERGETVELDDESRRALESLGYLTRIVDGTRDGLRPDPKRMVRVNQLLMAAMEKFRSRDDPGARRLLASALAVDPENKEIHRTMGMMHSAAGRYDLAVDWLTRCLALPGDERDPFPHAELGRCYLRLGRAEKAVEHLEMVLELDPDDPTAWNNLGVARSRLGQTEAAREAWTRALEIDPELAPARASLERAGDAR